MRIPGILVLMACLSGCVTSRSSIADEVERVIREDGIDAAIAKYRELKETSPEKYDFDIGELRKLGWKLFKNGERQQAIRIAELNAEMFPDSAIVYFDLAKAFHYSGDREQSRQNILRSLELDSLSLASVILKKKIFFVPDAFDIPMRLETDDLLVRASASSGCGSRLCGCNEQHRALARCIWPWVQMAIL